MKACSWNQFDGEEAMACQQLDAHEEINLISNYVCTDIPCPHIYLRVHNATSFNKCAGNVSVLEKKNQSFFLLFITKIFITKSYFISCSRNGM